MMTPKTKKWLLAIGIVIGFGLATTLTVVALNIFTPKDTGRNVNSQEQTGSAESVEKDAYERLEAGEKVEALSLFERALTLSKEERRDAGSIVSIETQIDYLKHDIKLQSEQAPEIMQEPRVIIEENEDGSLHMTPELVP